MPIVQVVLKILVGCFLWSSCRGQAPAPGPSPQAVCGDVEGQVVLCFPGSLESATCSYSIVDNFRYSPVSVPSPVVDQQPCPRQPIFGEGCRTLPGSLNIAFGPCNSQDMIPLATPDNTLPVLTWLRVMGLDQIEEMGSLFVRGYAYQPSHSLAGLEWFQQLETFSTTPLAPPSVPFGLKSYQVTITGLLVPRFPALISIPYGLSILNSDDVNFADRFPSLRDVSGGLYIAGCNSLTTLQGFEDVGVEVGTLNDNVQLINNLILPDYSALSKYFQCRENGTTDLIPNLVVGTIATHPVRLQPLQQGCSLHTAANMCQYIHDSTRCPQGTEYVRNRDGTIQIVVSSDYAPAPSPSLGMATASAPSPSPQLSESPSMPGGSP